VCKETSLVIADRQGIEIDYCPECRGVWLDRGELDKIIDRTTPPPTPDRSRNDRPAGEHGTYGDEGRYSQHGKKKKGGLLGDLFDFG
jgi:Zn-finger nucleic acid-binding protein